MLKQISSWSAVPHSRGVLRASQPAAVPTADGYAGSTAAPPPGPPGTDEGTDLPRQSLATARRTALLVGLAAVVTVVGCALPQGAALADPAPVSTSQASPESHLEARSFGVPARVLEQVGLRNPRARQLLRDIPETVRQAYRNLSAQEKQEIARQLQGTSGFLFFTVQNRQAFIDGKAGGVDVFDHLMGQLQEQVGGGKLERSTFQRLSHALGSLRTLTPQHRAAIVDLLETDVAASQAPSFLAGR